MSHSHLKKKSIIFEFSLQGFSASKCHVGNWIILKTWEFFERLFEYFFDFWREFFGVFWGDFFVIFWKFLEGFLGKNFLGGILCLHC